MNLKILALFFIVSLSALCRADLTLLKKFSHKTSFSLEQMVFKADYILIVKKSMTYLTKKTVTFDSKTKCPPYTVYTFNFIVQNIVKGDGKISRGMKIKVKEPFSDMAYTMHYSYYTRGFVIEPFVGEYAPGVSIDTTESVMIFVNKVASRDTSALILQFSILNASESVAKTDSVIKILNRPPADMKRLFLKHKDTK